MTGIPERSKSPAKIPFPGILFPEKVTEPYKIYLACASRGNEVFHASQRGDISMEDMYIYRYCKGFGDMGITITPKEALDFQKVYKERQGHIRLSDAVRGLLEDGVNTGREMGIITNGPSQKQWDKLNALGIEKYIPRKYILVSGDIGIDKPDLRIFHMAEELSGHSPQQLIYVGDSMTHDMIPAGKAGWTTVWYNRRKAPEREEYTPDYTVDSEENLRKLLKTI